MAATTAAAMAAEMAMVMGMATMTATATVMATVTATAGVTETAMVTAVAVVAAVAGETSEGRCNTMTNTMTVASISLDELFVREGDALDALRDGDGDAARVALADYLAKRLHTLILPHERGNVAIETMDIGCLCCRHDGWRGRGGKDDASGGGSGPTTPFVLKRTNCSVLSLSSGAGQTLTLEVILHASSVVASSSESAAW